MKPKIALYYPFLRDGVRGGAEKLFLDLKEYLGADFWVGGMDLDSWGKDKVATDSFVNRLWSTPGEVHYIHRESKIPIYRLLKRHLNSLFNPKLKNLNNYDIVIYSFGNLFFVPQRLSKKVIQIGYCHTPPRILTDKLYKIDSKYHTIIVTIIKSLAKLMLNIWSAGFAKMTYKISNSKNIQNRTFKYTGIKCDETIFVPVDINKYKFLGQKDYYLSYARLEVDKRLPLIFEAFKQMPDKKLVIASGGPLKSVIENDIQQNNIQNITVKGFVTDKELQDLVGNCISGIYIPENEDAGITQCEIMSAGKPVIGVAEGGLLETVIDGQTGILIPANPNVDDLIKAVKEITPEKALSYKEAASKQAKKFDNKIFFEKIDRVILNLLKSRDN